MWSGKQLYHSYFEKILLNHDYSNTVSKLRTVALLLQGPSLAPFMCQLLVVRSKHMQQMVPLMALVERCDDEPGELWTSDATEDTFAQGLLNIRERHVHETTNSREPIPRSTKLSILAKNI